jgi:phenylacetate-CoA ligase
VEEALLGIEDVSPHFQLVITREGTLDTLHVRVEVDAVDPTAGAAANEELAVTVVDRMRSALGLGVTVGIEPPGSVPRSEGGKLKRVDDRREV